MKTEKVILLALVLAMLAVSCNGRQTVTPNPEHRVGTSIEGVYDVYHVNSVYHDNSVSHRSEFIGHLELSKGQYMFTGVAIPQQVFMPLFFVKYPVGTYQLDYYGSINEDTLIENLTHLAVLATVRFSSDHMSGQTTFETFVIGNN